MKIILSIIILLGLNNVALSSTEDAIKGFAKYQSGRIENILLNEMLSEIKENRYFVQLFPLTNDAVNNYGDESGKRLIPLVQYFINKDISSLDKLSKCIAISFYNKIEAENNVKKITDESKDFYISLQKDLNKSSFTITKANNKYCLNKKTNAIYEKSELVILLNDIKIKNKIKLVINQLKLEFIESKESKLERKYKYWSNIYDYIIYTNEGGESDYIKVHYLILSFDKLGLNDGDVFYTFRKLSLFLAQLSDVSDKNDKGEAVEAVISNFVDTENDSFNIKRTGLGLFSRSCTYYICKPVVGIGSYFGFGVSTLEVDSNRVYGPVGIEIRALNYYGHMAYLGFSPLDFGVPIKNELTDEDYSISISDIRSNSMYLSYSYKHKPISVILSYHEDDINTVNIKDSYYMLSVAFDLPLYFF